MILLKSYFLNISYEAENPNFWATEKKHCYIWNPHWNIYKRTEPELVCLQSWKMCFKIGYFTDIPVLPEVKNIFTCAKHILFRHKMRYGIQHFSRHRIRLCTSYSGVGYVSAPPIRRWIFRRRTFRRRDYSAPELFF